MGHTSSSHLTGVESLDRQFWMKRQEKHPPSLTWWFTCTVIHFILSLVTFISCHKLIKPIDTGSELYRSLYERGNLRNTTWLPLANLLYLFFAVVYGFIYVNASNMNCARDSLFHSSYPNYRDFMTLTLLTL